MIVTSCDTIKNSVYSWFELLYPNVFCMFDLLYIVSERTLYKQHTVFLELFFILVFYLHLGN